MAARRFWLSLMTAAVLAACGGTTGSAAPSTTPEPSPIDDRLEHPTGATDLILRFDEGGGFVPIEFTLGHTPIFSLYGDGTVIFRRLGDWLEPSGPGQPAITPPLRTGSLTEAHVQDLLTFALRDGALALARDRYDAGNVADAPTATFVIRAGGLDKTVSVYALGIDVQPGADTAIRAAFVRLADRLRDFDNGGSLASDVYRPARYRGVLVESGGLGQPVRPWPWPGIAPTDFVVPADPGGLAMPTRTLTPDEAVAVGIPGIEGGVQGIALQGPDGTIWSLIIRPLLPDEAG